MTEQTNLPEAEDTKTRVTAKVNADTPGKSAPQIDLAATKPAEADSNTMTRRTLKLQGLAGLASPKPAEKPAEAPAAAKPEADDTRTRRTVKLASLAGGPAVKPLNTAKPAAPQPATPAPAAKPPEAPATAQDTVTRRTQKLEALDTQTVLAISEEDLTAGNTNTKKAAKVTPTAPPPTPAAAVTPRQTVKVNGIAPGHTPVIDLNAKVGDTNTRKTVKLTAPEASEPQIDLDAAMGDDTNTRKSVKVEPVKASAANVDDTVKLQRPAPKPAMPGSVTPVSQGAGAPAVGGIKLNKPAAPKPAMPKPAPAAEEKPATAPSAASAEASKPAEPTGNLGKNQEPPKEKKGLKVNTDAIKDLGSAPMVQGDTPEVKAENSARRRSNGSESLGLNITFAVFVSLAVLFMIFVAAVATTDYLNIWQLDKGSQINLPIISDYVFENIKK